MIKVILNLCVETLFINVGLSFKVRLFYNKIVKIFYASRLSCLLFRFQARMVHCDLRIMAFIFYYGLKTTVSGFSTFVISFVIDNFLRISNICVCVCVCVCIYIYIHRHIYIYTQIYKPFVL